MKKLLLAVLMSLSSGVYATELDAEHTFARVGQDESGTIYSYIGMYGNDLPALNTHGVSLMATLFVQVQAHNGSPKGAMTQNIYAVLCERQQYKWVTTFKKEYEGAQMQALFPDMDAAFAALGNLEYRPVVPNTLAAGIIDIGCKYTDSLKTHPAPVQKQKANPKDDPSYKQL